MQRHPLHGTRILALAASVSLAGTGCGKKKGFDMGDELGPAVLGGGGATRSQGDTIVQPTTSTSTTTTTAPVFKTVTKKRLKPKTTYNIVRVTKVIEATSDADYWNLGGATKPFAQSPAVSGIDVESTTAKDTQWAVDFTYAYPSNNFQFKEAQLVVDTKRDNSDTEGIYFDGVLSGIPPGNTNLTDPAYRVYQGTGGSGVNKYYIEHSLANYRRDFPNSFNLAVDKLVAGSPLTAFNAVKDGKVKVVLGDDSPIFKAYLVIKGDTISSDELKCTTPATPFTFKNRLVHIDGNSIGSPAFSGSVGAPYQTWDTPTSWHATEFYYNTSLPDAKVENITITSASLILRKAKMDAGGCPTIVINGIGVSDASCDRTQATSVVEKWDEDAAARQAWNDFKTAMASANGTTDITLDLAALLTPAKMKELLKQGKLNVALAGTLAAKAERLNSSLAIQGQSATSARAFQSPVDGPELSFAGTYNIESCEVVNDPDSPMTEAGFVEPPYVEEWEEYEEIVQVDPITGAETGGSSNGGDVLNDGAGPVLASIQVQDITSTGATIYWTTDEPSTSQAMFGTAGPTTASPEDAGMVTFHKVTLTGLVPYKYYKFQVISKDRYGNASTSNVSVFTTLR